MPSYRVQYGNIAGFIYTCQVRDLLEERLVPMISALGHRSWPPMSHYVQRPSHRCALGNFEGFTQWGRVRRPVRETCRGWRMLSITTSRPQTKHRRSAGSFPIRSRVFQWLVRARLARVDVHSLPRRSRARAVTKIGSVNDARGAFMKTRPLYCPNETLPCRS